MATMTSKRKRDSQDMPHLRAAPGMSAHTHDFDPQYFNTDDGEHGDNMDFGSMLAHHNVDQRGSTLAEELEEAAEEQQQQRSAAGAGGAGQSASDTAAAAMAQFHTMTIPQTTEQTFMQQQNNDAADRRDPGSAEPQQQRTSSFGDDFGVGGSKDGQEGGENGETSPTLGGPEGTPKPAVGSDQWHKIRRDNHKEVERRRRETINEGINELAKIVPGCEKNKGSILARAVQFITQLKENETQNIEKWTLEKLLTEQAIAELSSSCDKLKSECQRAWAECEGWKKAAQKAGVNTSVSGGGVVSGSAMEKEDRDAEGEED